MASPRAFLDRMPSAHSSIVTSSSAILTCHVSSADVKRLPIAARREMFVERRNGYLVNRDDILFYYAPPGGGDGGTATDTASGARVLSFELARELKVPGTHLMFAGFAYEDVPFTLHAGLSTKSTYKLTARKHGATLTIDRTLIKDPAVVRANRALDIAAIDYVNSDAAIGKMLFLVNDYDVVAARDAAANEGMANGVADVTDAAAIAAVLTPFLLDNARIHVDGDRTVAAVRAAETEKIRDTLASRLLEAAVDYGSHDADIGIGPALAAGGAAVGPGAPASKFMAMLCMAVLQTLPLSPRSFFAFADHTHETEYYTAADRMRIASNVISSPAKVATITI